MKQLFYPSEKKKKRGLKWFWKSRKENVFTYEIQHKLNVKDATLEYFTVFSSLTTRSCIYKYFSSA